MTPDEHDDPGTRTTDATEPLRPVAGTAVGDRHPQAGFLVAGFRQPQSWMDPFMTSLMAAANSAFLADFGMKPATP